MSKFVKIASDTGIQTYANPENVRERLRVLHSVKPVAIKGFASVDIVKVSVDVRHPVTPQGACGQECTTFPAIVQLSISAPEGTNVSILHKAASAAVTAFQQDSTASLFFPSINEITVV